MSVTLGNGLLQTSGDIVGVVTAWQWPNQLADVSTSQLEDVKRAIDQSQWRENSQAKDWIGYPIGQSLKLDVENVAHNAKIKSLIKMWIKRGALIVVSKNDHHRKSRPFVQIGDWTKADCATVKGGAAQSDAPGQSYCATPPLI
jgi:hypothetical protein